MTSTMTAQPVPTPAAPTRTSVYGLTGTDVSGLTSREDILNASGANFKVYTAAGEVECLDGVKRDNGTLSVIRDDTHAILGTHSMKYNPVQYDEVLDIALEAVTLSHGALDTIGLPDGGAQFYAAIDLGMLTLDPAGVADQIKRYLLVLSSMNATWPITFVNRMHRIRCKNEIPSIRRDVKSGDGFSTKHTKNVRNRLAMVKQALGIADKAEKLFVEQAERMMRQTATATTVERLATKLYPLGGTAKKSQTQFDNRMAILKGAFGSATNAGAVGSNMWAVYNVFTEYEDHLKGSTAEKRAIASLGIGNAVERKKLRALELCLANCN